MNVTDDPACMRDIADRLFRLHVPFMMSTIPHYINPIATDSDQADIKLSRKTPDVLAFVDALHYMTTHGGSLVMHGDTHQYHGVSSDDFEFWNGCGNASNQVLPDDSEALVEGKLHEGMDLFAGAQLYPLAWETPHYAASDAGLLGDRPAFFHRGRTAHAC